MKYYPHGSDYKGRPSKLHISDEDGKVMCGTSGFWMEQMNNQLLPTGHIEEQEHLPAITDGIGVCKHCLKKWMKTEYKPITQ